MQGNESKNMLCPFARLEMIGGARTGRNARLVSSQLIWIRLVYGDDGHMKRLTARTFNRKLEVLDLLTSLR
jgi:hypothetical protein